MRLFGSLIYFFLSFLFLVSCVHKEKNVPRDIASLQAMGGMEGIWFLQGTSSVRGPYNGELELRKSNDGTYDVVRMITYINYFYDGLKVQEVWTGKAVATQEALVISYDLRQADFISQMGGAKRNLAEFKNAASVVSKFSGSAAGLAANFSDTKFSTYSEWITTKRSLEASPLWIADQRKCSPLSDSPSVEYASTDFDFYRSNKEVIRVANKIADDISIAEAVSKRNAYALSLAQKAAGFDQDIKDGVTPIQDTMELGAYIASQAMRYQVTGNSEALENVYVSVKNLMKTANLESDGALQGALQGLVWASIVTPPSDAPLRAELNAKARQLLSSKNIVPGSDLKISVLGATAFLSQDADVKAEYEKSVAANMKKRFVIPSRANLQSWLNSTLTDLVVAERLGVTSYRDHLRERLMSVWVGLQPNQQDLLTIATQSYAYRYGVRGDQAGRKFNVERFEKSFKQALWGLRETPYPRFNPGIIIDSSGNSGSCGLILDRSGVEYLYSYWLARNTGVAEYE